jgi:hypothetical protein
VDQHERGAAMPCELADMLEDTALLVR